MITYGRNNRISHRNKILNKVNSEEESLGAFTASTYSASTYPLRDSCILDSGATNHVCNSRTRFQEYTTAIDKFLYAGNAQIPIDGFGSVTIKIQTPNGVRSLTLLDVAHTPFFHTNVISLRRFIDKGIYWDIQNERLTSQGNTFCSVVQHHS